MIIKFSIFILLISFKIHSQYSNYYKINSNSNINYSSSVNISGKINQFKTIKSIDYGELAKANALRESNRIELLKIKNEEERIKLLEISKDPSKAFDYGQNKSLEIYPNIRKDLGLKREMKYVNFRLPHKYIFDDYSSGFGWSKRKDGLKFINEDNNGIKIELIIHPVIGEKAAVSLNKMSLIENPEKVLSYQNYEVGKEFDLNKDGILESYLHKKEINRTTVSGTKGFVGSLIYEDNYEKVIFDNFIAVGISSSSKKEYRYLFNVSVRYIGDKQDNSFEELEGRRYYFKRLINKIISTIDYFSVPRYESYY